MELGDLVRPPLPRLIAQHSTTAATEHRSPLPLIWLTLGLGGRGLPPYSAERAAQRLTAALNSRIYVFGIENVLWHRKHGLPVA
jgi:hypothetical protein